ncbi:hypothetical protein T459_11584 [Capsicum annuum]|uniref:Uncharacterized protein n=1 Tax=Capsicum annuum TaxID=4072 RepID=A0A2G2ZMG4_CAPAN|nr:hypothetical protein T459_11584 [Capsicum annuum]
MEQSTYVIPRWTRSPNRSPHKRYESEINESVTSDDIPFNNINPTKNFSFSGTSSTRTSIGSTEAPSLRVDSEIERSIETENYYEAPPHITVDPTSNINTTSNFGYDDVPLSRKLYHEGIYLTWKDLWVNVPDKKTGRRAILQGLTGYVYNLVKFWPLWVLRVVANPLFLIA